MTSQLGKIRQWAGAVISTDKPVVINEVADLDSYVDVRKAGFKRLQIVSEDYHGYISWKQPTEALKEADKVMAVDGLGLVMIGHGEELGDDNPFGQVLLTLGKANCRVAALQETFAVSMAESFLPNFRPFNEEMWDLSARKKNLEALRQAYDAAAAKADKQYKKEKDRTEAEMEFQKAKSAYEEALEDVQTRYQALRSGEPRKAELMMAFVEMQTGFLRQQLEILEEVKRDCKSYSASINTSRESIGTPTSAKPKAPAAPSKDTPKRDSGLLSSSRFGSLKSLSSNQVTEAKAEPQVASKEKKPTEDAADTSAASSVKKKKSFRRKSNAEGPSRPSSRQSRKRSDSATTTGSKAALEADDDAEKAKTKKSSISVSGWVGGAMSSISSIGRSRVPDKDLFTALHDSDDDARDGSSIKRPKSAASNRSGRSHRSSFHASTTPRNDGRKMVRALYDFNGNMDELSFKAGTEIVVVNEVLDEWWLGEVGSRRGLFPVKYTEPFTPGQDGKYPSRPPSRPASRAGSSRGRNGYSRPGEEEGTMTLVDRDLFADRSESEGYESSDVDDDHPFGDHRRMTLPKSPMNNVFVHTVSATDESAAEDDYATAGAGQASGLVGPGPETEASKPFSFPQQFSSEDGPIIARTISAPPLAPDINVSSSKRIPPPPPPRRSIGSRTESAPQSFSSNSLRPDPPSGSSSHSLNSSPFESQSDLSYDTVAMTGTEPACSSCGCQVFRQDALRAQGVCEACVHPHAR